jgi:hypothetical protein
MYLGTQVKRGVASTLERVFQASGQNINKLEVLWSGKSAGIVFKRANRTVLSSVKVIFPSIDDMATISRKVFNNTLGYALHELGHAWFTDNAPWDDARDRHGSYVSSLINGLEDPRIEQCVIKSGYAPNAKALFEELTNSVLNENGYVKPNDMKNVPFMLAIEGRRLNGYPITHPTVLGASPWSADIEWALKSAQKAKDTERIVEISVELFKRLQQAHEEQKQQPKQPPQKPQGDDGQQGDDSQQGDQAGDQQGDQAGDQQGDQAGDQQGDQAGDQGGQQGDKADGEGKGSGGKDEGAGDGSDKPEQGSGDGQQGESQGEPSNQGGSGYSNDPFNDLSRKRPEFDKFIQNGLRPHNALADKVKVRPAVFKPKINEIDFR